jgi:hypothetical protein
LFDTLRVMKAFGYRYRGEGFDWFDWIKISKDGRR